MTGHSEFNSMLSTLLTMHEQGKRPDSAFIEANADVFEQLWAKGLVAFVLLEWSRAISCPDQCIREC